MIFASEEEIKLFLKRTLGTSRRQQLSEEKGMERETEESGGRGWGEREGEEGPTTDESLKTGGGGGGGGGG